MTEMWERPSGARSHFSRNSFGVNCLYRNKEQAGKKHVSIELKVFSDFGQAGRADKQIYS